MDNYVVKPISPDAWDGFAGLAQEAIRDVATNWNAGGQSGTGPSY